MVRTAISADGNRTAWTCGLAGAAVRARKAARRFRQVGAVYTAAALVRWTLRMAMLQRVPGDCRKRTMRRSPTRSPAASRRRMLQHPERRASCRKAAGPRLRCQRHPAASPTFAPEAGPACARCFRSLRKWFDRFAVANRALIPLVEHLPVRLEPLVHKVTDVQTLNHERSPRSIPFAFNGSSQSFTTTNALTALGLSAGMRETIGFLVCRGCCMAGTTASKPHLSRSRKLASRVRRPWIGGKRADSPYLAVSLAGCLVLLQGRSSTTVNSISVGPKRSGKGSTGL